MIWPCRQLEFLGIVIDAERMEFRLPEQNLMHMLHMLHQMVVAKKTALREITVFVGFMGFCLKCYSYGPGFSRRLFMATKAMISPFAHVHL